MPKLRFDTLVSDASAMISLRSFFAVVIIGEPQGCAAGEAKFFFAARVSDGDSARGIWSDDAIWPSRKLRSPNDSSSTRLDPSSGKSFTSTVLGQIAVFPFMESPGDKVASSSIWNIKSLVDCLPLRAGLLVTFGISFAGHAFPFDADCVVGVFSLLTCRGFPSWISTRLIRDLSFIESILRCLSRSIRTTSSGYLSKM